jgi:hypothetical protein
MAMTKLVRELHALKCCNYFTLGYKINSVEIMKHYEHWHVGTPSSVYAISEAG